MYARTYMYVCTCTYVRMYMYVTCTYVHTWLLHMHATLVPAQQWSNQDYECCPRRQCQREHSPLHFLQKKNTTSKNKIRTGCTVSISICISGHTVHVYSHCTYTQRHTHKSGMWMHLQTSTHTHTYVRAHKQEEKHTIWMCPHNTHIPTYVRTYSMYTVHTY